MRRQVLRLEDVRAGDAAVAGGKGAHLGDLASCGFPVPPGYVVGAPACRAFFDAIGLPAALPGLEGAAGEDLARRCAALRRMVVEGALPQPLADAILEAHARLMEKSGRVQCAVRSSATAEDLAGASFAGQHGTYYYVEEARLLEMVRHCWASLWTPEAVSYRAAHGIPHASVDMAVVVQEMVPSEVSGVAFTVHPVTGERGEIVIESSWGMGAAIVDGRVTPDRYVVRRDDLSIRERRIAEKRFMVPPRLEGGPEERMVAVPHELRRRETLRPLEVRMVAEWSLECERRFGAPQDVEWAFAGGRFHLLQSRAITTLAAREATPPVDGAYVLFKPLAENFTDPLTPLTIDVLLFFLPLGYRAVHGRMYMNLAYVRPFVPFRISDEDLAAALYLSSGPAAPPLRMSFLKLPVAAAAAVAAFLVFGVTLARTRGLPDDFMDGYRALCRRVEADPRLGPAEALLRLWILPKPFDPVGHMALYVNGSSLRFAPWLLVLGRLLRRWAPGVRPDAAILLSSGSGGVLSAEMGRSLRELAVEAKREPRVAELLAHDAPGRGLERLRAEPAAQAFLARLDAFLAVHGHRAVKEFELRSVRWEEEPAQVLALLRSHLLAGSDPSHAADDAGGRARADAEDEVRRALDALPLERRWGLRGRVIRLAAGRARYNLKLRENSRFYHILAWGTVRKKVLAMEADLLREGRLKCKDDVFFLRLHELYALRDGRMGWLDVEDRIRERRIEHVRFAKTTPPRTIGVASRRAPAAEEAEGRGDLRGQCASPGRYEGIARVILDPSVDLALRRGEVLVAPYTDPAWTPLFLTAGAAVVEVGSYLSHAGTVAREFGMPCLVDVADCTRLIQTGARLLVDADRGLVRILEAPAA